MEPFRDDRKYSKAKIKVDQLRRFYTHAIAYLVVNIIISGLKIGRNLRNGETFDEAFFDMSHYMLWIFWGIGLAFHAFAVFGLPMLLGKNWEEDKIDEFMKKDKHDSWT